MKKSNEKGFLLAEAIVVGVFVLSLFTFLFVNVVPLVGRYESEEKYDDIESVYNANLIRTMIMEDDNLASVIKLGSKPYLKYSPSALCNALKKKNYCTALLGESFLNVKNVYVTWYRTSNIKNSAKTSADFDRASRDYIDSIDGFTQPAGTTYAKFHRLIIYYNDGRFANVEIKVSE